MNLSRLEPDSTDRTLAFEIRRIQTEERPDMRGRIDRYSHQSQRGIIRGEDGSDYPFSQDQWEAHGLPMPGMGVEFERVRAQGQRRSTSFAAKTGAVGHDVVMAVDAGPTARAAEPNDSRPARHILRVRGGAQDLHGQTRGRNFAPDSVGSRSVLLGGAQRDPVGLARCSLYDMSAGLGGNVRHLFRRANGICSATPRRRS